MWEVKKISTGFLSMGHRILTCDCKVREAMVAKFELVL